MLHMSVARPARESSIASSARASSRRADASCSIRTSHLHSVEPGEPGPKRPKHRKIVCREAGNSRLDVLTPGVTIRQRLRVLQPNGRGEAGRCRCIAPTWVIGTGASQLGEHSHAITSPPYVNAQDYFRNFKRELYLLEDVVPFRVNDLRDRCVGMERGRLLEAVPPCGRMRRQPDRRREDLYVAGPADDPRREGLSTCRPIQ